MLIPLWKVISSRHALNSPSDSSYDSCLSDEGDSESLEGPSLTGGLSTVVEEASGGVAVWGRGLCYS